MKFGIDVSAANGIIDWSGVAKNDPGIDFVYIKASEGVGYTDKRLFPNVAGAVKYGIPFGFYHFCTFNSLDVATDAGAEAKWFLQTVKKTGAAPSLPLVLDMETNKTLSLTPNQVLKYATTFLEAITAANFKAAIYASPGFLASYLPPKHGLNQYPLWVADYSGEINALNGWKSAWLHQYTDKGKIQGITTNVDLDRII